MEFFLRLAVMPILHRMLLLASLASLAASGASAGLLDSEPWPKLLGLAGAAAGETAPDPMQLRASSTYARQFPLYRAVMAEPLRAPYRVGMLAHEYRLAAASPHDLVGLTGSVAGLIIARPPAAALAAVEADLRASGDPLATSLAWISLQTGGGNSWRPGLPDKQIVPEPLRFELALALATMGQAQQYLRRAFAQLPAAATPMLLRRQALDGAFLPFEEPDYRKLLALIEREALLAGMLDLTAAIERLRHFVATTPQLPVVAWTMDTPMGQIIVDTTGDNNAYRLQAPLLLLDVGGDDSYEFLPGRESHRISVVLDHKGNDRYIANTPGADPSAATLGYGILWDTEGDDLYQGTQHVQASALFGAALLVDGGGQNQYIASSHAQAHAIGGFAVLLGSSSDDQYTAQTHAQGSAGPEGVAVLIDPGGNDRYTLNNTPLLRPSPQLPSHNTSMGQGAGRGIRGDFSDGRSTTGGIGLLMDMAGDDHYVAQVFAQGAGYQEGLGLLVDDQGNDRLDAAWYAMGAGAHRGAGVLLKRGDGNDHYSATHSTALGAAHDFSVGIFVDEGGDDRYQLGDLGLGAAHDNSTALFVDVKGNDRYEVSGAACRALGAAQISEWGGLREDLVNLGLFMDLGGIDTYPNGCKQARNNADWVGVRTWPLLRLRSEAGAGIDGEFWMPFQIRPLTR